MLILKGNLVRGGAGRVLLAAALAVLAALSVLAGTAGPSAAAPVVASLHAEAREPEVVAAEFYGWYLETLAADQDPLTDRHERFNTYVARPLVEQLLQRLQGRAAALPAASPGAPPDVAAGRAPDRADYFLQSDRIEGAWLRSRVRAITVRQQARAAHVLVTLDGDDGAKHDLLLTMVLDNGAWKIRHVNRASVEASESSPDRPII